jgi:hypothetical protein
LAGGEHHAGDGAADARAADTSVLDLDAPPLDCSPTIGQLAQPIMVRPVAADHTSAALPIVAGGAVELVAPPQGGQVLLVGLEARNVRGCAVNLTARLRTAPGGAILAADGPRPTQLALGADGWGHLREPLIAFTANVTVCPLADLPRDVDGTHWWLELELVDDRDARATWAGDIVPTCWAGAPDPQACPCMCDSDFVFGQACPVDP